MTIELFSVSTQIHDPANPTVVLGEITCYMTTEEMNREEPWDVDDLMNKEQKQRAIIAAAIELATP